MIHTPGGFPSSRSLFAAVGTPKADISRTATKDPITVNSTDQRRSCDYREEADTHANNELPAVALENDSVGGAHDEWKDYSCATPWEYFVNDIDNAIGEFEATAGGASSHSCSDGSARPTPAAARPAAAAAAAGRNNNDGDAFEDSLEKCRRKDVVYIGRTYVLRMMRRQQQQQQRRQAECGEFPPLPGVFGEEEFALDALVSARSGGKAREEDEATRERVEQDEEQEASWLLRSW